MGLARASELFAAGVDFHGVHDWNQGIRTFVPDYNVLDDPEFSRRAFASSPMSSLDTWKSPVLLVHGDDDRNVSFIESINLITALRKRNVDVEQLVFPDEVHDFLRQLGRRTRGAGRALRPGWSRERHAAGQHSRLAALARVARDHLPGFLRAEDDGIRRREQ